MKEFIFFNEELDRWQLSDGVGILYIGATFADCQREMKRRQEDKNYKY